MAFTWFKNCLWTVFGVYPGIVITCPLLWAQVRWSCPPPSPTKRASGLPQLLFLSPLWGDATAPLFSRLTPLIFWKTPITGI